MRRLTTKMWLCAAALGAASAVAGGAQAATFSYSTDFSGGVGAEWSVVSPTNSGAAGILGELGDGGGSATLTRSSVGASAANAGSLSFDLLGFRTLDGNNGFDDVFRLAINGTTVFEGVFPLGSGGGTIISINSNGASVSGTGNVRTIVVPAIATLLGKTSWWPNNETV